VKLFAPVVECKCVGVWQPLHFRFKAHSGRLAKQRAPSIRHRQSKCSVEKAFLWCTRNLLRFGKGTVMKRLATLCLVLLFARPLLAVDDGDVSYVGGTVENLKEGSPGKLDITSQTELVFVSSSVRLVIPYASIDSYDHSQQVAHHLGVLPAIAVSLVKKRQRKHFLRIAYHDEIKTPQVAIFEVPKKMPLTFLAILQQRAPQGCKPQPYSKCRAVPD